MSELVVLNVVERAIQAVSLDGTGLRTLVSGVDRFPDGVVVDPTAGHIYWTNMGEPDEASADGGAEPGFFARNGSIERVDLDGGNRRTIVPIGAFTTGKQFAADFDAGYLYWSDREGMQVLRCRLDGSELTRLVAAGAGADDAADARRHCVGVAIDPRNRHLYWSQKGAPKAGEGRIFRASLDLADGATADDRDDIELLWSDLPEPIDLHLVDGSTLVWTDRGSPPRGNTLNSARVVPDVASPTVRSSGYDEAIGLASPDGVTFYVGDLYRGAIREVDLESGNETEVVTLGQGITGLALLEHGGAE